MGNITARSDVAGNAAWTYSATKKHAVTQAGNSSFAYVYDANGNMSSRQGQTIQWSSYNYPTSVSAGSGSTAESISFAYGPDRNRWQQIYTGNGGSETTDYVGGLMDVVINGSALDYRHYIYAGSEPIAVYSRKSSGVNTFSYLLSDHEQSIAKITNSSGTVTVSESFTAVGNRRNPTTWSGSASTSDLTTAAGISRQGYTFQTQLGLWMGLNHMNGRVQDAITGRFISADSFGVSDGNPQSFNRYSYAQNNPLTYIDPTGFDDCDAGSCVLIQGSTGGFGGGGGEWMSPIAQSAGMTPAAAEQLGKEAILAAEQALNNMNKDDKSKDDKNKDDQSQGNQDQNSSWKKIQNWLCAAGNSAAAGADGLANASGKLELAGLATAGIGTVTVQPEISGFGLLVAATGGAGNISAGVLQFSAGVLQGIGGGGFANSGYAAVSLATGFVLARGIVGPAVSGYRTVSQRASDAFANGTATVVGGVNDLAGSFVDAAAPRQVGCPGGK